MFILDERLENGNFFIEDFKLSRLLLSGNANFPWVILVPKINNLVELTDLDEKEYSVLMQEIRLVSKKMQKIFNPDKLNVAALGNQVRQLHIHIIARFKDDIAWPNPTFTYDKKIYSEEQKQAIIDQIKNA